MVEQENEEARQAQILKIRARADAYLAIFGPPGSPTPLGAIVLDDLDTFCTTYRESIHMDTQGRMDPYTTIYRDGKKAVALRIHQMIKEALNAYSSGNPGPSA